MSASRSSVPLSDRRTPYAAAPTKPTRHAPPNHTHNRTQNHNHKKKYNCNNNTRNNNKNPFRPHLTGRWGGLGHRVRQRPPLEDPRHPYPIDAVCDFVYSTLNCELILQWSLVEHGKTGTTECGKRLRQSRASWQSLGGFTFCSRGRIAFLHVELLFLKPLISSNSLPRANPAQSDEIFVGNEYSMTGRNVCIICEITNCNFNSLDYRHHGIRFELTSHADWCSDGVVKKADVVDRWIHFPHFSIQFHVQPNRECAEVLKYYLFHRNAGLPKKPETHPVHSNHETATSALANVYETGLKRFMRYCLGISSAHKNHRLVIISAHINSQQSAHVSTILFVMSWHILSRRLNGFWWIWVVRWTFNRDQHR